MWGSTASKRCNSPAKARGSMKRQRIAAARKRAAHSGAAHARAAHSRALLLVMFDAVVPIPVHLFRGRKFRRTDQPEAEPLRVREIPNALRELRILLLPVSVRAHARRTSHRGGRIVPRPATHRVRIRLRPAHPRIHLLA